MTDQRAPTRSPFVAIVRYTVRACVPSQRWLLLLPVAGALLFGLLSRLSDDPAVSAFAQVGGIALHTLILPITCLILGDALLGAEIRSGVFAFTWLSPVPYWMIVAGRWCGGCLIAALVLVPAVVAATLVAASSPHPALPTKQSMCAPPWS
ncbi:MAG: hypothetical protein ACR2HM_04410, partial [Acidimicrobiales bacterium]